MTLTMLLIRVALAALVLTAITVGLKKHKNMFVSYLQHFCGALFIFSGYVKAVDPLGTSYKMVDYFKEFETTFEATWISFIAPIFPWLASISISFSVIVIVFEIVLGVMLILGIKPKLTAWLFFGLVAFFTVLTGYTYLTGYVPPEGNFFNFSSWGAYDSNNMKVTDCGCFGDYIKLEPKTSFFKDVFLLFPAVIFLFGSKNFHQLFNSKVRSGLNLAAFAAVGFYCLSNFVWDIPGRDFRPFKNGVDIVAQRQAEEKAQAETPVNYVLTPKAGGEAVKLTMDEYLKQYKKYPKAEYDIDQQRGTPAIPMTKISEFALENKDGDDVTEDVLSDEGYTFMIVSYKLHHEEGMTKRTHISNDTIWQIDTLQVGPDSINVKKTIKNVHKREVEKEGYKWSPDFKEAYQNVVNPFLDKAEKAGAKTFAVVGGAGEEMIEDFRHDNQTAYPFYMADDITLKTIVRSNPGIVLLKKGKVVQKWHYKQLPSFPEVQAKFMK